MIYFKIHKQIYLISNHVRRSPLRHIILLAFQPQTTKVFSLPNSRCVSATINSRHIRINGVSFFNYSHSHAQNFKLWFPWRERRIRLTDKFRRKVSYLILSLKTLTVQSLKEGDSQANVLHCCQILHSYG